MRGTARDKCPTGLKPVQKVELNEKHTKLRFVLAAVFLLIGVLSLTVFVSSFFGKDTGWREIEAKSDSASAISEELTFHYYLGNSGISATAEYKQLSAVYSEQSRVLYQLYNRYETFEGINNLCSINQHPNEILEINPLLYQALQKMEKQGGRYLYLAPIYTEYENLFYCSNDNYAAGHDPYRNAETAEYFAQILRYANQSDDIQLEFYENNRVCLFVSEEYLSFAEENQIEAFLDFAWLRNAFIVDALADTMIKNGYTIGTISSYDGYIRNLDSSSTQYAYSIYDCQNQTVYPASRMLYSGRIAIVSLRNYPMHSLDVWRYYSYVDGGVATWYVDPSDGYYRSSLYQLVAYSDTNGCADIALSIAPVYIARTFNETALMDLFAQDIYAVWCQNGIIQYNGDEIVLDQVYSDNTIAYQTEYVEK